MSNLDDDCKLLGVSMNSDINEIKKAYKKMALKKHPDRGGNPEEFQSLSNAYERLIKYKQNPSPIRSFHNIPTHNTTMNDIFNEDIFQFAFNRGFPPGVFNNQPNQRTFTPNTRKIKIKTQIINGERKTTVHEFYSGN